MVHEMKSFSGYGKDNLIDRVSVENGLELRERSQPVNVGPAGLFFPERYLPQKA
jgi:hypothetical protein